MDRVPSWRTVFADDTSSLSGDIPRYHKAEPDTAPPSGEKGGLSCPPPRLQASFRQMVEAALEGAEA